MFRKLRQWHLSTLIIATLFVSTLVYSVFFQRPWQFERIVTLNSVDIGTSYSPDGTRILRMLHRSRIDICEMLPDSNIPNNLEKQEALDSISFRFDSIVEPVFIDDDTIFALKDASRNDEGQTLIFNFAKFKRRYNERAGFFARPTSWVLAGLLVVLVIDLRRSRRPVTQTKEPSR